MRQLCGRFIITHDISKHLKPLDLAAEYICSQNIQGDYLEFGVFKGASFIEAYQKIENAISLWFSKKKWNEAYSNHSEGTKVFSEITPLAIRYFAFDSFKGLPKLNTIDQHPRWHEGRFDCSEEDFKYMLRKKRIDLNKVVIIPGFYQNTLKNELKQNHHIQQASIIMIDCDLYESTKIVLDFVTDLITDGTIIIFDDWFNYRGNPHYGERRACQEWLEKNPSLSLTEFARWGVTQISFIVHKND